MKALFHKKRASSFSRLCYFAIQHSAGLYSFAHLFTHASLSDRTISKYIHSSLPCTS